jgi:hypothetical protein
VQPTRTSKRLGAAGESLGMDRHLKVNTAPQIADAPVATEAGLNAPAALDQFPASLKSAWREGEANPTTKAKTKIPRLRRRPDPLASANQQIESWFAAEPWRTSREFLDRLQIQHPQLYRDRHLRTLQRRLNILRRQAAHNLVLGSSSNLGLTNQFSEHPKIKGPMIS